MDSGTSRHLSGGYISGMLKIQNNLHKNQAIIAYSCREIHVYKYTMQISLF